MCNRNLIDKEEKRESCCFLNVIGLIESRSNQWFAIKVLQSKVDFLNLVNGHVTIFDQLLKKWFSCEVLLSFHSSIFFIFMQRLEYVCLS